jgi:hypothetical protein
MLGDQRLTGTQSDDETCSRSRHLYRSQQTNLRAPWPSYVKLLQLIDVRHGKDGRNVLTCGEKSFMADT